MPRPRSPKGRAREAARRLAIEYPGTAQELCALDFQTPFQLLVATVLSAQTTDERVNMVTPAVFARYPRPADLGHADPAELEVLIHTTGFFRNKARSLIGLGQAIDERFGGEVPTALEDLVTIPGVGRKTGNVVRSVAFGLPGLPVDTHVARLTRLLGLTTSTDPDRIEQDVCALLPRAEWGAFSLRLILHGRRVCIARRPRCIDCVMADFCPSAFLIGPQPGVARAGRRRPRPRVGAEGSPASGPITADVMAAEAEPTEEKGVVAGVAGVAVEARAAEAEAAPGAAEAEAPDAAVPDAAVPDAAVPDAAVPVRARRSGKRRSAPTRGG